MSQATLNFHKVVEVSNDLERQIGIGTLNYYSFPSKEFALQAIPADNDGWKWLDGDFFKTCYPRSFHPTFEALMFLLRHRYASATFKMFQVSIGIPMAVCKIRVYMLPLDIDGARFITQWRRNWLSQHLARRFKSEWLVLHRVLDYSREGWIGPSLHCSIVDYVGSSVLLLPLSLTQVYFDPFESNSSFHFARWLDQKPYYIPDDRIEEESLESVVLRVYNSISAPDVSNYKISSSKKLETPSSAELIGSLIREYPAKQLPGVKSALYPFQLKSLCKMFEKETCGKKEVVPYFKHMVSPTGESYYFDILDIGFFKNAELYNSPKGGILAENMGLGKTLICLSLICITKYDVSAVPDDVILHHEQSLLSGIRSLFDTCQQTIGQKSLPWKYYQDDLPQSIVEKLSLSPGYFRVSLDHTPSRLRKERTQEYQTLYLCNTTLLIVPENLFHQWNHEFSKHIEPSYLTKLFVSDRFKNPIHETYSSYVDHIPDTVNDLIKYDVVLLTAPLFAKICRNDQNILRNIYWKRLVIDEGHSMNSKSSNLSQLCGSLYAERRWAVTGTPTSGLTNLYMDEAENFVDSPKKKRKYVVKSKFNVRDDMVKLGNLVSSYFHIEPFHSQPKLWNSAIVRNLASSTFSTLASLQNLLNSIMVRHGLADVEQDLRLPQLHHEAVFISPSFHNKLAINLFTAVLAVNAVSSEREGVDYMFDPSNRQQLRRLVNNLQLATFYWTGFQNEDVNTLLHIAKHCMEKKKPNGELVYGESDQKLLRLSCDAANKAIRNPRWRTASMLHEMEYFVEGLPRSFIKSFGIGVMESEGVFGAPQLAAVQDFYYKNRFLDMTDRDKLHSRLAKVSRPFWERYWNDSKDSRFKKQTEELNDSKKLDRTKAKYTLTREDGGLRVTEEVETLKVEDHELQESLSVKQAYILGSASAKLSYLASKLVDHHQNNIKSIVFFEFEDSAYYLTELLDILGVPYILYATFIGAGQRSNNLSDFDSYDSEKNGGIALIMDLRLASHGLTIISATRVYFISPVWQRSVEAQAIKRAHRIGQTREVFVETLVLKGTLEEEIYRRRELEADNSESARGYVIDDTGMQQFILRHKFLSIEDDNIEYAEFTCDDNDVNDEKINPDVTAKKLDLITDQNMMVDTVRGLKRETMSGIEDSKEIINIDDDMMVDMNHAHIDHNAANQSAGNGIELNTENFVKNTLKNESIQNLAIKSEMNDMKCREYDMIPPLTGTDSSLLRHQCHREFLLHWIKKWHMYLFNPDNLEKLTMAKKKKASLDELNAELVTGKPEWAPHPVQLKQRKRVRF